jgi:hypothetical protein
LKAITVMPTIAAMSPARREFAVRSAKSRKPNAEKEFLGAFYRGEVTAYGAGAAGSSRMGTVLHFSPVRRPL